MQAILFGLQGTVTSTINSNPGEKPTVKDTMQAAVITGAIISFIVAPMEVGNARRHFTC